MRTPYTYGPTHQVYAVRQRTPNEDAPVTSPRRQWPLPAALMALSLVPMIAGAARVTQLTGGAEVTAENARFFASPAPVLVHIVAASLYCLLGAFQFVPSLRRRPWHRTTGRALVPLGLAAALSGLWMALFYPRPPADDLLLTPMRLVFGIAMVGCLVLGVMAIRRRDVSSHRAWMARGYAIGLGAGTQVLTHLPWMVLVGPPSGFPRVVLMLAGWLINVAIVEWALRRRPGHSRPTVLSRPRPTPAAAASGYPPR
jgi:uncharacterized membrane protein